MQVQSGTWPKFTLNRFSAEIITFGTVQYINRLIKHRDNWLQHQKVSISFSSVANLDTSDLHRRKGLKNTELTLWLSPDGIDCSGVVTSVHKSICFDPHREPIQVRHRLDHIHCHRCHLCTFYRKRQQT